MPVRGHRQRDRLENNPAPYRRILDAEYREFLFDYVDVLNVDGRWLTLRFSVNDTTADNCLFIEALSCR